MRIRCTPPLHEREGARGKQPRRYSAYALRISLPEDIQHGGTFLTVIPTGGCGDAVMRQEEQSAKECHIILGWLLRGAGTHDFEHFGGV